MTAPLNVAPAASAPTTGPAETAARGTLVGALLVGIAGAGILNAMATAVYDELADRDGLAGYDRPALRLAKRLRTPFRDAAAAVIAVVFGPVGMPIVTATAAVAVSRHPRRPAWFLLVVLTGIGSLAATVRDKELVNRNRPPRRDAIPPFESTRRSLPATP